MALLYYWRPDNYGRDLDFGAGYHLNQECAVDHPGKVGHLGSARDNRSCYAKTCLCHFTIMASQEFL